MTEAQFTSTFSNPLFPGVEPVTVKYNDGKRKSHLLGIERHLAGIFPMRLKVLNRALK